MIVIKPSADFEQVSGKVIREFDVLTIGVYAKLLSFGSDWQMNIKGLSKCLGLSIDKTRKAITELEGAGYIVRTPIRNENGKMDGWDYIIYGNCVDESERTKAGCRVSQNPTSRESDKSESGKDNNNIPQRNNIHKSIEEREKEFADKVRTFANKYPSTMLDRFINFWTEHNKSNTKMRFELQPTFEIGKRLATWNSNNYDKPNTYVGTKQNPPATIRPKKTIWEEAGLTEEQYLNL